jgi:ribosomal protein L15E
MSEKDEARAEAERRYPKRPFVYESHVQKSFVAGAEWQASRMVTLLESLTAYDKDGDLMLAESWPELRAQIEGVDE